MDGQHDHGPHPENPFAGQGAVLLDIGGDVGALVVTMPRGMVGEEVEVVTGPEAPGHHRPHVAVVDRPVAGGGTLPSLVFPALREGSYALVPKGTDDVHLEGNSDHASFERFGIPVGGIFTGLDDCYHQRCDTLRNVDRDVLEQSARATEEALMDLSR